MSENQTAEDSEFVSKVRQTLEITQLDIAQALSSVNQKTAVQSAERARQIAEAFQPVPWVIWRLVNFVFGKAGRPNKAHESMYLGLRKLLLSAASDKVIGKGLEITQTKDAAKAVKTDVVAASSVIHAISRKLSSKPFKRVWEPILEDAIMRAHIGYFVGQLNLDFGPGRGMLAGFCGRIGLAVLISQGSEMQADQTLDVMSKGSNIRDVGLEVYGVDPFDVSAMLLAASGCGKDAAIGTVSYASEFAGNPVNQPSFEQSQWTAAYFVTDLVRTSRMEEIQPKHWQVLGFYVENEKEELGELVKLLVRRGHGWDWMM